MHSAWNVNACWKTLTAAYNNSLPAILPGLLPVSSALSIGIPACKQLGLCVTISAFFGRQPSSSVTWFPTFAQSYSTDTASVSRPRLKFASASSQSKSLLQAVIECAEQIRELLGPHRPHLCHLLITPGAYGAEISQAPKYVRELLNYEDERPMVVGGVLNAVSGGTTHISEGHGVSILAAHLPEVDIHPFYNINPCLPYLQEVETWPKLLQAHAQKNSSIAAVVYAPPHFAQVEEFVNRLGAVLPSAKVMGGITAANAWGDPDVTFGAVFLEEQALPSGAAGVLLHGDNFLVDTILTPGYKPVGPIMTATLTLQNLVVELDNQPAHVVVRQAVIDALGTGERDSPIKMGIDDGQGGPMVVRNWTLADGLVASRQPLVLVASSGQIKKGTKMQLHIQDFAGAQKELRHKLVDYTAQLTERETTEAGSLAAMVFSCSALKFFEGEDVEKIIPTAVVAGGKVEGEFGSLHAGEPLRLHSFSSAISFMRSRT